jgi:UrcA family protein
MFATKSTTRFTAALAAALSLVATTPAFAEPAFESNGRQIEVRYTGLDLTSASDRQALKRRLGAAADKVCASNDEREFAACRKIALQHVKRPVATAIARAETNARYAQASSTAVQVGN